MGIQDYGGMGNPGIPFFNCIPENRLVAPPLLVTGLGVRFRSRLVNSSFRCRPVGFTIAWRIECIGKPVSARNFQQVEKVPSGRRARVQARNGVHPDVGRVCRTQNMRMHLSKPARNVTPLADRVPARWSRFLHGKKSRRAHRNQGAARKLHCPAAYYRLGH